MTLAFDQTPYSRSEESFSKGEVFTAVVVAAAAVEILGLLTGYTVGGRRTAVMNTNS